jgi:hypothetical protein
MSAGGRSPVCRIPEVGEVYHFSFVEDFIFG